MLTACQECGKEISSEAKACPHCGKPTAAPGSKSSDGAKTGCLWIVGSLAIAFGIYAVSLNNDPDFQARMKAKAAMEECRKPEKDELLPIDARRFFREACDQMAEKYRQQFGRPVE